MPIFDFACNGCGNIEEHYLPLASSSDPNCERCGAGMSRMISMFQVVFTGAFSHKYQDSKKDDYHKTAYGHYAFNKDGSREYIDSFDKQREFCRRNKFINPKDLPANLEVSKDGRKVSSAGLPGQW